MNIRFLRPKFSQKILLFACKVYWQAPPSGNGCVTLRSMVAENENSWYEDGAPLSIRLCEDMRQPDDITPQLNYECEICDEAKYEVITYMYVKRIKVDKMTYRSLGFPFSAEIQTAKNVLVYNKKTVRFFCIFCFRGRAQYRDASTRAQKLK